MRAAIVLLLVASLCAEDAAAKTKVCFTAAEENAEQIVRGGLRLREGALGCDGPPWEFATKPLWDQVEQKFGPQFKQQTDLRAKAFIREFARDAENHLQMWNGRIVTFYRNFPLSAVYCGEIKKSLQTMMQKGWGSFTKQARTAKDEVEMDYRLCN